MKQMRVLVVAASGGQDPGSYHADVLRALARSARDAPEGLVVAEGDIHVGDDDRKGVALHPAFDAESRTAEVAEIRLGREDPNARIILLEAADPRVLRLVDGIVDDRQPPLVEALGAKTRDEPGQIA
nr:hypothetical protein [Microbacterium sp.]